MIGDMTRGVTLLQFDSKTSTISELGRLIVAMSLRVLYSSIRIPLVAYSYSVFVEWEYSGC